jgi:hypothetical protein
MKKIVGVDAGYVNFAVCGVDTRDMARPYYWQNSPLFKGAFTEEKLVEAIYAWINKPVIKQLLEEADVIVLERQMTMKFQAVNHCIRFLYFAKTVEANPNTVRAFFDLPRDRASKKKETVTLVTGNTVFPISKGKKDDLSDAYLLAAFYAFSTVPSLREVWKDDRDPGRKFSRASGHKGKTGRHPFKRTAASDGDPTPTGDCHPPSGKRFAIDLVGDEE